ncbi:unnamed protein product [Kuraishia capsulata CBS 1993]|uniref:Uncharacterized protein n=1 Tax=Kuraishia capsulata CBS 1993 TaxID=1382522 RepID=W6MK38_9ASCO|nr:uncharacterized protein KUCA_T00000914001 [Kuraishia capsulata CBS 1993]CDK24947.1 unnamed protein product [Kuraishia capsulata CBS 1993]
MSFTGGINVVLNQHYSTSKHNPSACSKLSQSNRTGKLIMMGYIALGLTIPFILPLQKSLKVENVKHAPPQIGI